jgi:hypothetical protein
MKKSIFAALFAAMLATPAFAGDCYDGKHDSCPPDPGLACLVAIFRVANEECRGGVADRYCAIREKVSKSIEKKGLCFGANGYLPSGMDAWHPCSIKQREAIEPSFDAPTPNAKLSGCKK